MVHERPPRQPGDDEAGDRGLVVVGVDDVDRVPGDDPPEARRQREIAEDATEARARGPDAAAAVRDEPHDVPAPGEAERELTHQHLRPARRARRTRQQERDAHQAPGSR